VSVTHRIVVVGAGQAGLQLCETLRRSGHTGPLVLVGDEPHLPYQRPPLSKKFLTGELDAARLALRPAEQLAKLDVALKLGVAVSAIQRDAHEVVLADGERLGYDRLVLATGTRVRRLPAPGAALEGVCHLRGLDDAQAIKDRLGAARRLVVIGGGFIGLEVAAVARSLGKDVTIVEAQDRLMPRVVAPLVSEHYARVHAGHGVHIHLNTQVEGIVRAGEALAVALDEGASLPADLVVVGIGVVPNVELAREAGLHCENGIVVDEYAQSSDRHVLAIGDVAWHRNVLLDTSHRLESVQHAVDQAKTAAATLLGKPVPYAQVPWFWSDQYDLKLQMAGINRGHDSVVLRGTPDSGAFSVCYYEGTRLLAMDSINKPLDHMLARKLLAAGVTVPPTAAADPEFELKTLLPAG
jgi:3-phenylpropionate/trans-cinnamate dioxygenase ferredoxin reductase subunit